MIWVSGSIARDLIMDFPGRFADYIDTRKIHVLNLSFAVENLRENIGGTAANIAYNLTMLRERPEILGNIGQDQVWLKSYFGKLGIGVSHLRVWQKSRTAAAYIITDRNDNQLTGFYAGAMYESGKLPEVRRGDWAIVAAENPRNMVSLARHYQRNKVNYVFDPGQQITALSAKDLTLGLRGARVLIGNDYEIGLIAKKTSLPTPIVVRTLGPKGSEILTQGHRIKIGIAKPKKVLDPTGAGDAYRAGFLKGLILGYNLKTCGQLGATIAVYAVEKYGTQNHKFTWPEVVKRHNRNFKEEI